MPTQTFTWAPAAKPNGATTFRVLTAQFGDGYEQTAADGINNKTQSWPLSFVGPETKIKQIAAFLDALQGSQSFYWTPPLGAQGFYKSSQYNLRHLGGEAWELTCTFKESFQP